MMESIQDEPRVYPASRLVAYTAMLMGASWALVVFSTGLWVLVYKTLSVNAGSLDTGRLAVDSVIFIVLASIVSVPGLICFQYGRSLFKYAALERVRRAVGVLALITGLILNVGIVEAMTSVTSTKFAMSAPTVFGVLLVMLPIYTFVCRQILIHDGFEVNSYRDIMTKRVLLVLAWLMWFLLSGNVLAAGGGVGSAFELSVFLYLGLAILIAWGFYRISLRVLGHKTADA